MKSVLLINGYDVLILKLFSIKFGLCEKLYRFDLGDIEKAQKNIYKLCFFLNNSQIYVQYDFKRKSACFLNKIRLVLFSRIASNLILI